MKEGSGLGSEAAMKVIKRDAKYRSSGAFVTIRHGQTCFKQISNDV